jgi:hypothetical protein
MLKCFLWISFFGFSLYFELATIFLILSAFYFIYLNLGVRNPHKPSAYSVFNKNLKKIPGIQNFFKIFTYLE